MYILDKKNTVTLQLSNDAFFYLLHEEEPLDEANLEEAQEIMQMFKYGFIIEDNWFYADADIVEATFIPYAPESLDYDTSIKFSDNIYYRLKWQNPERSIAKVWVVVLSTGFISYWGELPIQTNEYGLKYFEHYGPESKQPSVIFLKNLVENSK